MSSKLSTLLAITCIFSIGLSIINLNSFTREVHYLTPIDKEAWINVAKKAWRYFTPGIGVSPITGLHYESPNWKRFTDWDLGMYIIAILRAEELGLVSRDGEWGSEERLNRVINFLLNRKTTPEGVPYLCYDSDTGEPCDEKITNPSDSGRLLAALWILMKSKPQFKNKVLEYISKTNYTYIATNRKAWRAVDFYRYLDSLEFKLWGFDRFEPVRKVLQKMEDIESSPMISVYGVALPRMGITSEPLILGVFDLNSTLFRKYLDLIYEVQKRRYLETGIITAWSEGGITHEPYYVYEYIVTPNGKTWVTSVPTTPVAFTKTALSFAALYDDKYAKLLFSKFSGNYVRYGYLEGISEDGKPTFIRGKPYLTGKTNAMIISAAHYVVKNKFSHVITRKEKTPEYYIVNINRTKLHLVSFEDEKCEFVNGSGGKFDAAIIYLPQIPSGYVVRWMTIKYKSRSDKPFPYNFYLLEEDRTLHRGPTFISHTSSITDVYRFDLPSEVPLNSQIRDCFLKNVENISLPIIILMKKQKEPGHFHEFDVLGIEIILGKQVSKVPYSMTMLYILAICFGVGYIGLPLIIIAFLLNRLENPLLPRHLLIFSSLTALLIRLCIAPFTGHPYDMEVWRFAGRVFFESKIIRPDLTPTPIPYYTILGGFSIYKLLNLMNLRDRIYLAHTTTFINEALSIKLSFIAFDFVAAYLLARIVIEFSSETPSMAGIAALLYLFNPLVICVSSFWGLYESIGLTFMLGGLYFMLKRRYISSSLLFGLASATKLYGFIGLAILLVYLIRRKKYRLIPLIIFAHLGILFFTYLPLASWNPIAVIEYIFATSGFLGRLGLASSTNFIPSASYMMLIQMLGIPISPPILNIILALTLSYPLLYFGKLSTLKKVPTFDAVKCLVISYLITYLFFFRVYEQYYVWIVPFVILLSILSREKSYTILMTCLTTYISSLMVNALTIISGEEHYIIFTQLPKDAAAINSAGSALVALMMLLLLKPHSTSIKNTGNLLAITILTALSTIFTAYSLLNGFSLTYAIPALALWTSLLLYIIKQRGEDR